MTAADCLVTKALHSEMHLALFLFRLLFEIHTLRMYTHVRVLRVVWWTKTYMSCFISFHFIAFHFIAFHFISFHFFLIYYICIYVYIIYIERERETYIHPDTVTYIHIMNSVQQRPSSATQTGKTTLPARDFVVGLQRCKKFLVAYDFCIEF